MNFPLFLTLRKISILNIPSKKALSYLIKAAVLLLAAVFIYRQVSNKHDLNRFESLLMAMDHTLVITTMFAVFLMMFLNWGLEAAKWKYLAQPLTPMTLWASIEAVFCGLTWAIFTPNRIGEYGGRVLFLTPRKRIHGVFAMAVGSFGQNVITNVLGAGALMWFIATYLHINPVLYFGLLIIATVFILLMLLFYFNIRWMISLLNSIKFLHKFHRFFDIMGRYNLTGLLRIMIYCLARFTVFSFQYYLVIHLLVPDITLGTVLMLIFILFFIQSALPSLDLLDVGVRNLTAVTLFSYVTDQKLAIMAAVSSIWLINLIIPAILGSVFVFKLNFLITIYSYISLLFTGLYLVILVYLIKGWLLLKSPKTAAMAFKTRVTILIAARNEAQGIHRTIEDLLAQDYPRNLTEIIIVDDHSTDNTAAIISSYAGRGVQLLQLNESEPLNSYKKKAIAEAIKQSTGDLMIATDADCRMGPQWVSSIVNYFETEDLLMISSPVTYFEERSTFERLQTLEFAYLIGIGAAFIGNDRASTCNGANFAYRKDTFYEVGGFTGIDDLASGDDELLLQKVAARYPGRIGFLKKREAIVYTHAKPDLKSFLNQRRRWASKSTKYKDKKIIALAVSIWFFNVLLLVNVLLGFYDIYFFKLFALQMLLKYLLEIIFLLPILSFFKRAALIFYHVILSPLHIIYFVYVGIKGNTGKYSWKGRMVR